MDIIDYTGLRSNLKYWLDKVVDDVSELIVKRKNGKDLIILSLKEYNSLKETAYLLQGENGKVLRESIKELEAGKAEEKKLIE